MESIADVTVVSAPFIAGLGLSVASAWTLAVMRRPFARLRARHRSWSTAVRGMVFAMAAVLTVALAADGVNAYYSFLPNVSDVVDAVSHNTPPPIARTLSARSPLRSFRGRMGTMSISGPATGLGTTQAWIWLPPQYFTEPEERFPVVYLFHGSPGRAQDWFHGGEAARAGAVLARDGLPVIEVAPQMSRDWLDDPECVDGRSEKIETHLLRDVIPTVDRTLRTIADRNGRVFAGMSAGGYCALNMGLRHRDVAATILDMSGYTDLTHTGGPAAIFGAARAATDAAANDPDVYARTLRHGPPMAVWLDSGRDDHDVLREMDAIAPVLRTDHMTVVQHTRPGGHTYSVWRPALLESLAWALRRT